MNNQILGVKELKYPLSLLKRQLLQQLTLTISVTSILMLYDSFTNLFHISPQALLLLLFGDQRDRR